MTGSEAANDKVDSDKGCDKVLENCAMQARAFAQANINPNLKVDLNKLIPNY